jgi:Tol biopolymer transport system component
MAWSADGQRAYASSDATGTPELWQLAADAAPLQLTEGSVAECSGLWPSPCGRWLLYADERQGLALLTLPPPGTS